MLHALTPSQRRIEWFLVAALWADFVFKFAWFVLWVPMMGPNADYDKHWYAAIEILNGRSPYVGDLYLGFNYPLFTGWLFIWLPAFSLKTSELIWESLNALYLVGGAALVVEVLRPRLDALPGAPKALAVVHAFVRRHWFTVIFAITINFHPLIQGYMPANIDPFLFGLFVAFGVAFARGRDTTAGILLAALCLVKLTPVLLLVPLAAARKWRVLAWSCGLLALYGVVLLVTGLWRTELYLYQEVLPRIGFRYIGISASTNRVIAMLFVPSALETEAAYRLLTNIVVAALAGIFLLINGAYFLQRRTGALHILSLGLVAQVLMTPLFEFHHMVWIAPVMYFHLWLWMEGRMGHVPFLVSVGVWVGITVIRILNDFAYSGLPFSAYLFSSPLMFVLAGLCVVEAFRSPREGEADGAKRQEV